MVKKNKDNEYNKLIERLEILNNWRRGADIPQPDPKQIGKDIDEAIKLLKDKEK